MEITRRNALLLTGSGLLQSCSTFGSTRRDADVIIIGAGLSGLAAARHLEAKGIKTVVLEASDRIGGRMHTLYDLPGTPEAGGAQVGQSYTRLRTIAAEVGIYFRPSAAPRTVGRTFAYKGSVFHSEEWAERPSNPFPEPLKSVAPDRVLFASSARSNPLKDIDQWRQATASADISVEQFLKDQGFSSDAISLTNIALNANDVSTYSMVNVWRSMLLFGRDSALGGPEYIVGGSQRLPEAMAADLDDPVKLSEIVRGVSFESNGVQVDTNNGSYTADFVIAAIPFPALKRIEITPALPMQQQSAIAQLPYTQIQKVHLTFDNEFWKQDGLPISMWTDTPIERVFPTHDLRTGELSGLMCWINGKGVRTSATDKDWFELAETTMRELRGANTRGIKVVRWDSEQPLSGGAYMHWAPGQIGSWAAEMGKHYGRLYFAGEHLSQTHTGMEGAIQSGELAAEQILERAKSI